MLKENAIQAYERSELFQVDLKNEKAANRLKKYLSNFGIEEKILSDSIVIDNIRFVHQLLSNEDEVYAYKIIASRNCSHCGEHLSLEVLESDINDEEIFTNISPVEFGQWLSKTHHCEYPFDDNTKSKIGFNS